MVCFLGQLLVHAVKLDIFFEITKSFCNKKQKSWEQKTDYANFYSNQYIATAALFCEMPPLHIRDVWQLLHHHLLSVHDVHTLAGSG